MKKEVLQKSFSLRLSKPLSFEIRKLATSNGLAVTSQIRMLIIKGLAIGKKADRKIRCN